MEPIYPETESPRRNRGRFQYSLRTLLIVMLLASIGMSWFAVKMQRARRQKEAVEAIRRLGGKVLYPWQANRELARPGPAWLCNLLGEDFFATPVYVYLLDSPAGDADLEQLKVLPQLQRLDLFRTKTSDAGLEHLRGMTQLQLLVLDITQVTDAGLEHLKGLAQLRELSLDYTQVTDAGLEHLKGLTQLRVLVLDHTPITDAGLEHLKELKQLQQLYLTKTKTTDEGVKRLRKALPNCNINWSPPTKDKRQDWAAPDQLH